MQITARQPDQIELKVRDTTVSVGPIFSIGQYILPGPGEYEVAGVMVEVMAHAARLIVDDFQIGFLRFGIKKLPEQELEQLGTVDILCASLGSETNDGLSPKELLHLAGQLEARLIIPLADGDDGRERLKTAFPQAEIVINSLKITRSQLPEEGFRTILFDQS